MKEFEILGIKMHKTNMQNICELVEDSVIRKKRIIFCWNNPETIYQAQGDQELREYFNKTSNYNFVDGSGIILLKKLFGENVGPRNTGTDFLPHLFQLSSKSNIRIYLLGGKPGIAEKNITYFSKIHGEVNVVGYHHGFFSEIEEKDIIQDINQSRTDVLAVFLGCPRQERFIQKYRKQIQASVLYGGGGGLDYYSGVVKRAPNFVINIGLEFIWRLLQDFTITRLKRQSIYPIFTLKTIVDELKKKRK